MKAAFECLRPKDEAAVRSAYNLTSKAFSKAEADHVLEWHAALTDFLLQKAVLEIDKILRGASSASLFQTFQSTPPVRRGPKPASLLPSTTKPSAQEPELLNSFIQLSRRSFAASV